MPKKKIRIEHLADENIKLKGKYAVAEVQDIYVQGDLSAVPAGTRGIITGRNPVTKRCVFLFPHEVIPDDPKSFSDGRVRVIPSERLKIIGRIDLD